MEEKNKKKEEVYTTKDIWLASYLQIKGHKVIGAERDGSRFIFIFRKDDMIQQHEMEYLNREALVDITTISSTLKMLKTFTRNSSSTMGQAMKNVLKNK